MQEQQELESIRLIIPRMEVEVDCRQVLEHMQLPGLLQVHITLEVTKVVIMDVVVVVAETMAAARMKTSR